MFLTRHSGLGSPWMALFREYSRNDEEELACDVKCKLIIMPAVWSSTEFEPIDDFYFAVEDFVEGSAFNPKTLIHRAIKGTVKSQTF